MNINRVSLRRNGNLAYGNYPTKIILHHPEFNGTIEQLNEIMINGGFTMIGYNYYVRKDGSVWEGRPVDAIGGNCYGQNATSIGIAFEGNFMIDVMGGEQFNTGMELCKYLLQQYPQIKEISPHKKYWNTDCPGKNFPVDKMVSAAFEGGTVSMSTITQSVANSSNLIKLWDSGSNVKDLQEKLIKLGYELYGGADGIFGQSTYNAVEHFQASRSLMVDGIVGPITLKAIDDAVSNIGAVDINTVKYLQKAIGVNADNIAGPVTLAACPQLKQGSQDDVTRWLQIKLGINADGAFGNTTKITVQNFQAKNGLSPDGIVGQDTWRKLLGL